MSVGKSAAPAGAAADVEFAKGQLVLYRTRDGAWVEAKVGPSCATPCLSFQLSAATPSSDLLVFAGPAAGAVPRVCKAWLPTNCAYDVCSASPKQVVHVDYSVLPFSYGAQPGPHGPMFVALQHASPLTLARICACITKPAKLVHPPRPLPRQLAPGQQAVPGSRCGQPTLCPCLCTRGMRPTLRHRACPWLRGPA